MSDCVRDRRLTLLKTLADTGSAGRPLVTGQMVPDFTLIDQAGHPVTLSQLRGKVVAINFIYTSCALPQFCFRIANHFSVVAKRFAARVRSDLTLLTITFDPVRDQPEKLAQYAGRSHANPDIWHFLTGTVPDIKRVVTCSAWKACGAAAGLKPCSHGMRMGRLI